MYIPTKASGHLACEGAEVFVAVQRQTVSATRPLTLVGYRCYLDQTENSRNTSDRSTARSAPSYSL